MSQRDNRERPRKGSLFGDESDHDSEPPLPNILANPTPTSPKSSILKDTSSSSDTVFSKFTAQPKVAFAESPPDANLTMIGDSKKSSVKKKANLIIRPEEEARIVLGLQKASKKQATGAIFSVVVDISKNNTLDIGVKDLPENLLVVSMLKRGNDRLGAAEEAGIRLGDVIFGINFIPTREGSKTLITVIKLETEKHKKFLHIQGWRCHQLCSDPIPGYLFPRADDMFVRGYDLAMSKVFNDWERWNFIEIILGYMVEDLHNRAQSVEGIDMRGISFSSAGRVRARQMQALDLEKNILQAKGLRSAINVRIVQTKNKDDTVVYILRVEDVESGLVWMVSRRYNEFHTLYEELNDITHSIRDVDFPRKRLTLRLSVRVVEQRVTMLEQFLRKSIHTLTHHASIDSTASNALRRIQHFLAVEKHVDCIHPPVLDDQRTIELMAYRFLNDFNSPACLQCVRFTNSVELDGQLEYGEEGYRGLLSFMHDALAEVEQFVQQQHEAQLLLTLQSRRPEWTEDQQLKLVRQCIRRQVEAALYLPLRRSMVRLLLSSLETKVKSMQRAVAVMMPAKPSVFMVDPNVVKTKSFPKAVTALRKALLAHLPSDQGQFLVEAANIISEVHTESKDMQRATRRLSLSPKASSTSLSTAGQKAVMSQTASSSSATRSSSNDKVAPSSSSRKSIDRMRSPIYSDGHHDELRGRDSFSSSGQKLRQSLSDRLSNLLSPSDAKKDSTPHDSEDDLDVGLDDEILRVSFTVTHNHHAVSLGPDEQLRFTASTAKKIATYTPKRDIAGLERHIFETTPADSVRHSAADEESAKKEDGNEGVILSSFPSPVSDPLRDSPHLQRPLPPVPVAGHSERKGGEGVDPLRSDPLQSVSSVSPAYVSGSSVDELTRATGSLVISSSQPTAQSSVYNNYAGNRQSTRQLDRMTSSRQADAFVDPLLHPPTEDEIHCGNHVDTAIFAEVFDRYRGTYDAPPNEDGEDEEAGVNAISADDFLPIFTFVVVHAQVPQLFLLKELMVALIANEDSFGECGYYLATLEAALQHIGDMAAQFDDLSHGDDAPTIEGRDDVYH